MQYPLGNGLNLHPIRSHWQTYVVPRKQTAHNALQLYTWLIHYRVYDLRMRELASKYSEIFGPKGVLVFLKAHS